MLAISAFDALLKEEQSPVITTYASSLDKQLGGGIPIGTVTEICGMAGLGKTQLWYLGLTSMQLCANVQIPQSCDGVGGSCLYLDTEGSFVASRMAQIAGSMTEWIKEQHKGIDYS